MNRTKLKNYAPQARRDFIEAVTARAAHYGLTAQKTELVSEQGDVAMIGGRPFPRAVAEKRKKLVERINRQGFAATMEAMAYTWFNRFVAIRFMELHGYLDHGYRVLSHPEAKDTPEILQHAEHVTLPGLDRERVIELKLDGTKEAELYRLLLVAQCNALHAAMPFLFEQIDDETELLLPDNLLHSDSLIRRLVRDIDEADWQQVEIIGWLYQFYISEKKDEVIGKVVRGEDIPAATQLFTPNWIVKYLVQNSVGRMWMQTYPDSALRAKMDYYIEPAEQEPEVQAQLAAITPASIDPETITVLDPACGSGHILVEAYDLLKEIYLERGYRLRDVPRLILSKNLFGLDIDDRAAQLAAFALLMKARADDRRIFDRENESQSAIVNVMAIQESAHLDAERLASDLLNAPAQPKPMIDDGRLFNDFSAQPVLVIESTKSAKAVDPAIRNLQSAIRNLVELFRNAKTFGSLITIPDDLARELPAIADVVNERLQSGNVWERPAAEAILIFVRQAAILAGKYDCVIANPPYMGSLYFNLELKDFVKQLYVLGKDDLYGCFISRSLKFAKKNGFVGMITIPNWMFLASFEKLRESLIHDQVFDSLTHNGRGVWGSDFGSCSFVIRNSRLISYRGSFKRLFDKQGSVASNDELGKRFFESMVFTATTEDLKKIPGIPIAYWVSDQVRRAFTSGTALGEVASPKKGLVTSDNNRFLKRWVEVAFSNAALSIDSHEAAALSGRKWFAYSCGGEFRKWYGNNDLLINWEDNGREIIGYAAKLYGAASRQIQNTSYYFKPSVTWSNINSSYFGVRITDGGFIFGGAGSSAFPQEGELKIVAGFLNTSLANALMSTLNPTVNFLINNVASLPILDLDEETKCQVIAFVDQAVEIARLDWDSFETSWDYQTPPLLRADLKAATVEQSFLNWQAQCEANIRRMQELETENNRLFIEAYGLQDELSPEVPEEQITLARADREADIRRLVSYAVGCMMGRYSLDRPSLVYAESGNVGFDPANYATFPADADGIVPVTEGEWFADDAANRFVEFIEKAWPPGSAGVPACPAVEDVSVDSTQLAAEARQARTPALPGQPPGLEDNLRYIAESLGPARNESPRDAIRRYFAQSFFKDHLKTYKKRPIYWLFSSGKQRAFQCLVYLHRYNEGTLARMRTEYVIPLQGKLSARIQQLQDDTDKAASTSQRKKLEKEQGALRKQQAELLAFDEKLRHYADQRIRLDLDDGVKVNYGKFGDLLAEVKAVTGGGED